MRYEPIMRVRVGMAIHDKKLGYILAGGMDPPRPLNEVKVPYLVDKCIMVKTATEELIFKVKKMDLSTSIAGFVNIGIIIYDSDDFSKIKSGDEVLAVLD